MSGSAPNLQHSDSSLSLRTIRKNNQDFRALAAENLARKGSSSLVVDERVFNDYDNSNTHTTQENERLLSEVIEMGPDFDDESWRDDKNSKRKDRLKICCMRLPSGKV